MALKRRSGDLPDAYAVFLFDQYYPAPGWDDFHDAFDTLEQARECVEAQRGKWDGWQIVNLTTLSMIDRGTYEYTGR